MSINKDFNHSFWEKKHLFKKYDVIIVGAGIVGLSTALSIKERHKKSNILIIERGALPTGASTKNAGFACFGSVGEILDDLLHMDENSVWQTVAMRYEGLKLLRKRIGDKAMQYKKYGGYEIFKEKSAFQSCLQNVEFLNKKIKQNLGLQHCFQALKEPSYGFNKIVGVIKNKYEGQIETGLMMKQLEKMALEKNINILFNCNLIHFLQLNSGVQLETNIGDFLCDKMVIATNGFAKNLIPQLDVNPARSQVLITKPIKDLKIKGSFHFDKGYYYFRNIDNRILLGGGRNLDFKTESTDSFALNTNIQKQLDFLLKNIILPKTKFEVDYRWTGIMGVGKEKKPIIDLYSQDIIVAVRMGGMGLAIGSLVGDKASKLI